MLCVADDGTRINVEVQLVNLRNMEKRTLYYWAKMYQSLHRGEEYEELNRAITINLLNFSLLPQKQAHTMYGLYDLASGHRLTEDIEIHFLEIPNFEVKSVREMKRLERWLAYFSNKLNETETEALAMYTVPKDVDTEQEGMGKNRENTVQMKILSGTKKTFS